MDELTFLDLAILKKIDAESSVEKFGSIINTSFFETANMLGTIKIKGYITIEASIGGISKVALTDAGTSLLAVAQQRCHEPIEPLDNAILHALASGAKELEAMQTTLNVRSADLAYHINKLVAQGFMDYELRSAKAYFMLTEQGFNSTGSVRVQQTLQPEKAPSSPLLQQEETEELALRGDVAKKHPDLSSSAPPWVNPAAVAAEPHKEDVAHLLKEESKEHPPEAEQKQKRQLTPEEAKKAARRRRMLSKLQYYIVEYTPYLLLMLVVAAIFVGAIFLSLTKLV